VTVASDAPTVQTAANAGTNPVINSDKTTLSVLGADDHGESNLTYTWSTTSGPVGVVMPVFSVNSSNAAKTSVATFFAPGSYQFTVTITDSSGKSVTSSVTVAVADSAFPAVSNVDFDYRRTLKLTFNTDVGASLSAADLQVTQLPSGVALTPDAVTWDAVTRTATFTFVAPLPNENYRATLAASGVQTAGGRRLAADAAYDFYVLAGDVNRDRVVNYDDLLILAKYYNSTTATWAEGDLDGNGFVNFDDLLIVAKSYNATVAALPPTLPAPAPAAAASVVEVTSTDAAASTASLFNTKTRVRPPPPPKPVRPVRQTR
jgi:hypothetical protein